MFGVMSTMLLAATSTGHVSSADVGVFVVGAAIVLAGAVGVVVARNPVHAALMLVMTLFGIAVLFVLQRDDFLAVVQVIVYAGAIVVLFLFVIMFLGVDRQENIRAETLRGQRPMALVLVLAGITGLLLLGYVSSWTTGAPAVAGSTQVSTSNVTQLGTAVFTTYLFPFEVTSALLVIAVVGAVVLARRPPVVVNSEVGDEPDTGDEVEADAGDGADGDPAGGDEAGDEAPSARQKSGTHEEVAP
jgi:NADH-quinone oxidoreductase subunit J